VEVLIILGPTFGSRNVHGPTPTDIKGRSMLPSISSFLVFYVPFFFSKCMENTLIAAWLKSYY
jgi:hypothetical protein